MPVDLLKLTRSNIHIFLLWRTPQNAALSFLYQRMRGELILNGMDEPVGVGESVTQLRISELHPFPNHPFKVWNDDAMKEMLESIMEYGVLTPVIVRP